jgi:hypothetical protein
LGIPLDVLSFHTERLPPDIKRETVSEERVLAVYKAFRREFKGGGNSGHEAGSRPCRALPAPPEALTIAIKRATGPTRGEADFVVSRASQPAIRKERRCTTNCAGGFWRLRPRHR